MAACDICQRCLRDLVPLNADNDYWCPNCGPVVWLWVYDEPLRVQTVTNGGYFPTAKREETGYYVDNPYAGLREPARVWVEGKPIT